MTFPSARLVGLLQRTRDGFVQVAWRISVSVWPRSGPTGRGVDRHEFEPAVPFENLLAGLRAKSPIAASLHHPGLAEYIRRSGIADEIIAQAEAHVSHRFSLLGSGWVELGSPLPWHEDFLSGKSWPSDLPAAACLPARYPGGFDIKVPWELSRCQHFVRLGQAYFLTGDSRFADAFVNQMLDWIDRNPIGFGVNWASTMEAGLRAINWIWALSFFLGSPNLNSGLVQGISQSLFQHGSYVYDTFNQDPRNNHYLVDLLALMILGMMLPESDPTNSWATTGKEGLENEMMRQVGDDGCDTEGSSSYHRLATEVFLTAAVVANHIGRPFSAEFMKRLEKMTEFIADITRSDGSVPLIGDGDNGRVQRLGVWHQETLEWSDFRDLLAVGGVLFDRDDLLERAGGRWQDAAWLLGLTEPVLENRASQRRRKPLRSVAYPEGGYFVVTSGDRFHAVLRSGNLVRGEPAGHTHNDALSLCLHIEGVDWLVDPGTICYTRDYAARNESRSTQAHSTVEIDAEEINGLYAASPFGLRNHAHVDVLHFGEQKGWVLWDAAHDGYLRLRQGVLHRRQVLCDPLQQRVLLHDILLGEGFHRTIARFHLGGDIRLEQLPGNRVQRFQARQDERILNIIHLASFAVTATVEQGWLAPGYGQRVPGDVVHLACQGRDTVHSMTLIWPGKTGISATEGLDVAGRILDDSLGDEIHVSTGDMLGVLAGELAEPAGQVGPKGGRFPLGQV